MEMRLGDALFIPSAVVSHETMPIEAGEERDSLALYSTGGLFRWLDGGRRCKTEWETADKAGYDANFSSARRATMAGRVEEYSTLGSLGERRSRLGSGNSGGAATSEGKRQRV